MVVSGVIHRSRVVGFCLAFQMVFFLGDTLAVSAEKIVERNPFDPARRPWADVLPPAPPSLPISADDLQLYGVAIAGDVKRAVVKVGGNLKQFSGPGGRAFLSLREGQSLGTYTVLEIQPNQLILAAGASRHVVLFGKKTDRPSAPLLASPAPPAQDVQNSPVTASLPSPGMTGGGGVSVPMPAANTGLSPSVHLSAGVAPVVPSESTAISPTVTKAQPIQTAPASQPGQGMSLADAIAAAQTAAAQGNLPPTPNPFQMRK